MQEIKIDKKEWGHGPWENEPDRLEWEHAGLPCLMVRQPSLGHWCGYAAVPLGHPFHGVEYSSCAEGCDKATKDYVSRKSIGKAKRQGDWKKVELLKFIKKWQRSSFYKRIRNDHPTYECGWKLDHSPEARIEIHGGLTYSGFCDGGRICHMAKEGEPDNVYWFGFDCAHAGDVSPGMSAFRDQFNLSFLGEYPDKYRDVSYVQAETNRLAQQLASMK